MAVDGKWYNELGSLMDIKTDENAITGVYMTAVGDAGGRYHVTGRIISKDGVDQALSFCVAWDNAHGNSKAATAWCGQYQVDGDQETIVAMWLLTNETEPDNDWQSTMVNKDVFTRTAPTDAAISTSKKRGVIASHPKKK